MTPLRMRVAMRRYREISLHETVGSIYFSHAHNTPFSDSAYGKYTNKDDNVIPIMQYLIYYPHAMQEHPNQYKPIYFRKSTTSNFAPGISRTCPSDVPRQQSL